MRGWCFGLAEKLKIRIQLTKITKTSSNLTVYLSLLQCLVRYKICFPPIFIYFIGKGLSLLLLLKYLLFKIILIQNRVLQNSSRLTFNFGLFTLHTLVWLPECFDYVWETSHSSLPVSQLALCVLKWWRACTSRHSSLETPIRPRSTQQKLVQTSYSPYKFTLF